MGGQLTQPPKEVKTMPKTVPTTASTGSKREKADGPTGQAQEKAQEVASQAQDKAREAAGQARGRIRDQVDQRSTQIGDQVNSNAGDARSVAEELRSQGKDTPARYVDQAADRAERLGGYLQNSDGDQILRDVEDFGRRNPWAVAAGGLLLGFAASRLLKASSSQRYQSSQTDFASRGSDLSGSSQDYGSGRFGRETLGEGYGTRPGEFEPHV
jgi:ElaB/YqjD/DUF883 family membrane-anchored ribosome-binding protein